MHATTSPTFDDGFLPADAHPYENDAKWIPLVFVGLILSMPLLAAFIYALLIYTPE